MKSIKFYLILFLSLYHTGCTQDLDRESKNFSTNQMPFPALTEMNNASQRLLVVNEEEKPIANATLIIGQTRHKDNLIITNSKGEAFIPKNWTATQSVTIEASGYIRMTYVDIQPTAQTFQIHKQEAKDFIEIKGQTKDYGRLRQDGYIDFALIIPAFTPRNMINFDLSSVISPSSDTVSAAGQKIDLPSNISLPKQRESYIIPITFEKPEYRSYVRNPGFYKIFATHGRFPFKSVVDDIRAGNSALDVINKFEFLGGGQKNLQINNSLNNQDISIREMSFDQTFEVKAPHFHSDVEMLSLSLMNQGGHFYPSDLKRFKPGQKLNLKYLSGQNKKYVLSALLNKEAVPAKVVRHVGKDDIIDLRSLLTFPTDHFSSMSALSKSNAGVSLSLSFEQIEGSSPVSFIEFVTPPVVTQHSIQLDVPQRHRDISPVATYVTLSKIESLGAGKVKTEKKTRKWEFLASGWQSDIELPKLNMDIEPNKSYRWEVLFLGRKGQVFNNGGHLLDGVTHASRSSYNF